MVRLWGIGVSGGVAGGPAVVAIQRRRVVRFQVATDAVAGELAALDVAQKRSREQLEQIRTRFAELRGAELATLFDAQLLLLDDPMLMGRARDIVQADAVNAEWALQQALDESSALFDRIDDSYLRERKGDLQDVVGRLLMNLRREGDASGGVLRSVATPCVLVADELSPSIVAALDWTRIVAFITDAGSRTHHTAILARSLGVPAVVGLHDASTRVPTGAWVSVDGATGEVVIDPPTTDRVRTSRTPAIVSGVPPRSVPVATRDGVEVHLRANIERPEDVARAANVGAEGIGLYRTEYMLSSFFPHLPTEDEQYQIYRRILEGTPSLPVTIRTFDVDARQLGVPSQLRATEDLGADGTDRGGHAGLRGIRLGLERPDFLKTQLHALLRASTHGRLCIMFPFVTSADELHAASALLEEVQGELEAKGLQLPHVPVGAMIEVPSAALTAIRLARHADFLTIGTNDLIQYLLAVDRTDDRVSDRYDPLHPAVLKLLRYVRRSASRRHIPVSVCGEMASDPLMLQVLVGCGLRDFSMTPEAIPAARQVLGRVTVAQTLDVVRRLLDRDGGEDADACLADLVAPATATEEWTQ